MGLRNKPEVVHHKAEAIHSKWLVPTSACPPSWSVQENSPDGYTRTNEEDEIDTLYPLQNDARYTENLLRRSVRSSEMVRLSFLLMP